MPRAGSPGVNEMGRSAMARGKRMLPAKTNRAMASNPAPRPATAMRSIRPDPPRPSPNASPAAAPPSNFMLTYWLATTYCFLRKMTFIACAVHWASGMLAR